MLVTQCSSADEAVTTQVLQAALELLATMLEQSLDAWGANQLLALTASLAARWRVARNAQH